MVLSLIRPGGKEGVRVKSLTTSSLEMQKQMTLIVIIALIVILILDAFSVSSSCAYLRITVYMGFFAYYPWEHILIYEFKSFFILNSCLDIVIDV